MLEETRQQLVKEMGATAEVADGRLRANRQLGLMVRALEVCGESEIVRAWAEACRRAHRLTEAAARGTHSSGS